MNKLGFGFMRMPLTDPDDQTAIDILQLEQMVDRFFAAGFTYCDTAWMYHDFMSEPTVGKAVVGRYPRDSFTVASKMPVAMIGSHEEGIEIFESQKKKLGVEYFDYYLVHDMNVVNYEKAKKYDMISYLRAKKDAGEIRCLGFSCHDTAEFLDRVLTESPFFEFVQLQINYLDWESEGMQSRKCYEVCVKHGKPVIVMEPVKGGTLANPPAPVREILETAAPGASMASWAIRCVASLPGILTVLSGMSNVEQMADNLSYMKKEAFRPLDEAEQETIRRAQAALAAIPSIPCTGCNYCAPGCPMNIPIPDVIKLYNESANGGTEQPGIPGPADCIACGQCRVHCPQGINISGVMKAYADKL